MNLSKLIKKEFKNLSFYDPKKDHIKIVDNFTNMYVEFYRLEKTSKKARTNHSIDMSFSIDFKKNIIEMDDLDELDIASKYQGQGWGRALIEKMESIGRKYGIENIQLNTVINESFFKYLGYEKNNYIYEKKLTKD